ncbi:MULTISPECIES: FadR/GntR family transcriptional regulator [Micrococcus]|uniref:Transcriptional regulator, GntR family n=3 Tax=Micrococcus TaxID=1269 RepID=A0ABD7M8W8_MICLU|nr:MULTISPECIES: FCD domain-containing protein [Micrococcus]TFI17979.1 FadR family transcriptional regulator [Thiopseudomonas sp. 4R-3cl]AWD25343.1 FadR family transcriptional regulator [Micrococcus luteus]EZP64059.1 FCD domain protein [Micrococcus luteus]KIK90311.1 GntR family transcriptional regulator [Micrococcus luteus]KWW38313.1 Glc operon transcriptional activator [Micrococcus luteus]
MTAAPAYTIVLDWLEAELRSGAVVVGDKLPGERTLAERFGISRASVREATRMLEAMGLIRASAGSGPNSGAVVVSEPSAALGWALRLHIATRSLPMADVVAARVLLETDAAQAAAATSGDPESVAVLAEVETLLDRMDDPALPEEDFHLLDTEFHVRLATLGGNVVTAMMLDSLRQATIGYVTETVAGLSDWPAVRAGLQADHRRILAASAAGDGRAAAQELREHVLGFAALAQTGRVPAGG